MPDPIRISVPDLGTDDRVEVVEILVAAGEVVAVDDGLVTLESDKATMDVPSPEAGTVRKVLVKVGDRVATGDPIALLEPAAAAAAEEAAPEPSAVPEAPAEPRAEPGPRIPGPGRPSAAARHHAEILVLGGGPGGYTAAFRAADLGKKVVLVERYPDLGGVCLNVGCIPSKALLHVARAVDEAAELESHGVEFGPPRLDLPRLRSFKDATVRRLTRGLATMADQRRIERVEGAGHFNGSDQMTVVSTEGARSVSFETAIIAAGSRVMEIPGIPYDDERVMDSTDALELPEIPDRLLVIGGGIIGLEMATIYGSLGAEVTVVELLPGLLPGCDRDLVRPLQRRLERRHGATVHVGTRVTRIEAHKRHLEAFLEGSGAPQRSEFDRVLVAVGRRPNGDRLNLEAAGVDFDERGFIPVDRRQRTNVPHIFAIGDITGQPMLAHKATHQGKVAAEVAAGHKSGFDARVIPVVAYTDPEVAWVGLSETEAAERGVAYEKGSFPWAASGRALGIGRTEGLTKILFDPETRRILGAGVVGPGAGDLIAELALAIEMDCEAADIGLTVHPHPTLSETIGLAAEVFEGTVTDLYLGKRKR